jgi:hypothetical protein
MESGERGVKAATAEFPAIRDFIRELKKRGGVARSYNAIAMWLSRVPTPARMDNIREQQGIIRPCTSHMTQKQIHHRGSEALR